MDETKTCADCGARKPVSEFYVTRVWKGKTHWGSYCKPCNKARTYAWVAANKERRAEHDRASRARHRERRNANDRAYHLRTKYGLTVAEADAMYARGCDVCGRTTNLAIDHDHDSRAVRGVLCVGHNSLEGVLRKARADGTLDLLLAYLEAPPGV